MSDPVNSPSHYAGDGSIECIDAIEAMGIGKEFCQGNAVKYLWRLGKKDAALQDSRKAQWYVNRLVQIIEREQQQQRKVKKHVGNKKHKSALRQTGLRRQPRRSHSRTNGKASRRSNARHAG